jgi:Glu-tRNA(Gln) amidotransferase subunit E-like FAD-binding protein
MPRARGERPPEGDPGGSEAGSTSSKHTNTSEETFKTVAMSLVGILKKASVDENGIHDLWDNHARNKIEECVRSAYYVRHLMASLMSNIVSTWTSETTGIDKINNTYLTNVISTITRSCVSLVVWDIQGRTAQKVARR